MCRDFRGLNLVHINLLYAHSYAERWRAPIKRRKKTRRQKKGFNSKKRKVAELEQRLTLKDEEQKTARQNLTKTTVGLAELMQLTPNSMKQMKKGQQRRSMHSRVLGCVADAERTGNRSSFLENVVKTLAPLIRRVCEIPKFTHNDKKVPDPAGVANLILRKMHKDPKVFKLDKHPRRPMLKVSRKRKLPITTQCKRPPLRRKRSPLRCMPPLYIH